VSERAFERARHLLSELERLAEVDDAGKSFDCESASLISAARELVAELSPASVQLSGDLGAVLPLARDAFDMLIKLTLSGTLEKHGFPDSPKRAAQLLHRTLLESVSFLLKEDETASLETFGGKRAVKELQRMYRAVVYELPKHLRVRPRPIIDRLTNSLAFDLPEDDETS
jgi:hypothetical protein